MRSLVKSLVFLSLVMALSVISALVGLGLSSQRYATPADAWGYFAKIHPVDGWIQDGARIYPKRLAPRGNTMELVFNAWRPAAQPPAHLQVSVCGKIASEFVVTSEEPRTIFLTGSCEPRTVEFKVLNPFSPSPTDTRKLGAQLKSVLISSRLGFPLIAPMTIALCAFGVFTFTILVQLLLRGSVLGWLGPCVPLLVFPLIRSSRYVDLGKLTPVWMIGCAICVGLLIARHLGRNSAIDKRSLVTGFDRYTLAALCALLLGGVLRFYGIDFGLPANFHPDEVPKVNAVMRMVDQQTLNPQYFLHPSLLLYSTYFVNSIFHFLGMEGEFRDTAFLAGRTVSALGGIFSIYFIYIIGRRLFSAPTGVLSAFILAVLPLHVVCSRYLKEDALLTAMLLACAVAVIKAVQEDKSWLLLLAGFLAGCAASTKYSGLLAVAIVGAAPWLRSQSFIPDKRYIRITFLALCIAPLGFIACTPYSVLDATKFVRDFNSERNHMQRGHTIRITAWSQFWMYHLWRSIVPGVSLFTTFVAAVGMGLLLWRRRINDLYLIALFLLFYLPAEYVNAKPAPQPERYILPCLPFLAVMASEVVRAIYHQSRMRSVSILLGLLAVTVPAYLSWQISSEITDDTRDKMAAWMKEHLPRGSKIYIDWKPYEPTFQNDEFEMHYAPRDKLISSLKVENLKQSDKDYLLLSSLWYGRYFDQPRSDLIAMIRLRRIFAEVPVVKEFRAVHGTYGFHNPTVTLFALDKESFAALEVERAVRELRGGPKTQNEVLASFNWKYSLTD